LREKYVFIAICAADNGSGMEVKMKKRKREFVRLG
jgi:hypothetical protein